jgi:hypothetical protein
MRNNVYFPNRFDIFLQMANQMWDSNSKPNQVWKWDLQSMWPEALPFLPLVSFASQRASGTRVLLVQTTMRSVIQCYMPVVKISCWQTARVRTLSVYNIVVDKINLYSLKHQQHLLSLISTDKIQHLGLLKTIYKCWFSFINSWKQIACL